MKKNYLRVISTDSIGWLGNANQFIDLYGEYFNQGVFDAAEAIAVKPLSRLKKIIHTLEKAGIKTISLHGRTGGENQLPLIYHLIMLVVNKTLLDAKQTLKNFKNNDILFHSPYSENSKVAKTILKYNPKKLILENHRVGKQGIEDTIKQVRFYRSKGINTFGLIDIYHYVYGLSTRHLKKNWKKIVNELEKYFLIKDKNNLRIFNSVHFPIGTRIADSLPIEEMSDEMLRYFAKKITPYLDRFVIENQVKNLGLIFSTKSMIERTKKRNTININRLVRTGLL